MRVNLLIAIMLLLPRVAMAAPCAVKDAREVGHGRMTVMFWDVYDATLKAPGGIWRANRPFSLTLDYLRDLEGRKIAERSIAEMRHIGIKDDGKLARWQSAMEKIFPDVHAGSSLTGVYTPGGATEFCQAGRMIGRVNDPLFGPAFFGIWLDPKTSAPAVRRQLLGNKT